MKKLFLPLLFLLSTIAYSQDRAILNVKDDNDFATFSIFDSLHLKNYNVFFTGEDHRYRLSNSDLELKMFKYLHKTHNVNVFIVEFGQGMGYLINKFVYEGDSVAGNILKLHSHKAYYRMFENMKNYNDSLPQEKKFFVQSLDLEREPVFVVKALEYLLPEVPEENAHDSIKLNIESLKALASYFDLQAERYQKAEESDNEEEFYYEDDFSNRYISSNYTLELIIENFRKHKEKYAQLLGNNFAEFEKAIGWIEQYDYWKEFGATPQQYIYRENNMLQNAEKLFANPDIKAYGQFGRCHISFKQEFKDCDYYYFNALAKRLNNSSNPRLKNKVFSCPIFYPKSSSFDEDSEIDEGLEQIANLAPDDEFMLFLLDTAEFPSHHSLAGRYNAVIVNKMKKDKSEYGDEEEEEDYHWEPNPFRVVLAGHAGVKTYNFKPSNTGFGTNFENERQFYGFSLTTGENNDFNTILSYFWYPATQSKISDSVSASLRGYTFNLGFMKDLLKVRKYDMLLGMGLGYEQWTTTITQEFNDVTRRDILGNNPKTEYTNPGFILDAILDFKVHISRISMGAFARYQLDISNKRWKQFDEFADNSPRLSLNSYMIGATLGFNFR